MEDQKKELSVAIWADTNKMKVGEKDLWDTMSNWWSQILKKDQISISMDKWEKELAKKRSREN